MSRVPFSAPLNTLTKYIYWTVLGTGHGPQYRLCTAVRISANQEIEHRHGNPGDCHSQEATEENWVTLKTDVVWISVGLCSHILVGIQTHFVSSIPTRRPCLEIKSIAARCSLITNGILIRTLRYLRLVQDAGNFWLCFPSESFL